MINGTNLAMEKDVRVRFAPSPTGALHIGGLRTALYNYLFARKHQGKFILRIEDTDQSRLVPWAENYIYRALEWCGISPHEGVKSGGEYGPYRQSERSNRYQQYARQLIDAGNAYYAFDSSEELEAMRKRLKAARVATPQYNAITRSTMKNSLTLPEDEVKKRLESGDPYVIRLKVPRKAEVRFHDRVRGWIMVHSSTLDDKVLMKSDGLPTYHLANVVDDHLMDISHVIRGEEWLPSAPTHVLLYQFLGWENDMPEFAHLPLLLKPDGNGKLSKRDGEKYGFPVFPLEWQEDNGKQVKGFKEEGYLPEAIVNFLAFLGWNPGGEQEIFSKEELISKFSLERVGKSGIKFDINKAQWYNQQYIKLKSSEELARIITIEAEKNGVNCTLEKAIQIVEAMKDRVTFPHEFWSNGSFFFFEPSEYSDKIVRKKWTEEAVRGLEHFANVLERKNNLTADQYRELLHKTLEEEGINTGKVLPALRLAITGSGSGPDLMSVLSILGSNEITKRIQLATDKLSNQVKS